jgi:ubiquinone biosynthesis UbiH/UbiF/VisC/COQ6 family hydroxylase
MVNKNLEPVIVFGSGLIAGLTSKMLLNHGFEVIRITKERTKPLNKIFAISPVSINWFDQIGLSKDLINSGYPINKIDIFYGENECLRFDSGDIYKRELAFMVKEEDLMAEVELSLDGLPLQIIDQSHATIENHETFIKVIHKNEVTYSRICLWCDGSSKGKVEQFNIVKKEKDYHQHAITFNFFSDRSYKNQATQFFFKDSVLALLPISEYEVSVVWSCDDHLIEKLKLLDEQQFVEELSARITYDIGSISKVGVKNFFPIKQVLVSNLFDKRILLLGDAAHTIHPMAGQGLNMGIRDIQSLERLIESTNYIDIGARGFLRKYERSRQLDITQFSKLTVSLHWLFSSSSLLIKEIIRKSFKIVNSNDSIKSFLIRKAAT